MLSILIPVYNYNIESLVSDLHKQLTKADIVYEIICLDDASHKDIITSNLNVNTLPFTSYHLSNTNNGIAVTRQMLTDKANYDWIVLLDADVELKDDNFISNYVNLINKDYNFIFGGFAYKDIKPDSAYLLRWKYGKKHEALSAQKRNTKPYKITIAANLLARKASYKELNLGSIGKQYAMDYYFGALLKENNAKVLHLDNQVYHLGIEESPKYLRKKEQAAETLLKLYNNKKIAKHENSLLSVFILLNRFKLNYLFSFMFKITKTLLRKNLLGKYPVIVLLQFYKISYMCYFNLRTKTPV